MRADCKGEFKVASYIDTGKYYDHMTAPEIALCYNGMGAEWMSPKIRYILDDCFHIFRDAVLIHDIDYAKGLTELDKHDADERLLTNCRRCVWHKIKWWRIFDIWTMLKVAKLLYLAVAVGGDKAFWAGKAVR